MSTTHSAASYLRGHRASGLKVGDTVRVMRKARTYEQGWGLGWISEMDGLVGTTQVITVDEDDYGFGIQDGTFCLPHFVLKRVKRGAQPPPPPVTIRLNSDYTATIHPRHVEVGCQSFPHAVVLKVAAAIKRVRARSARRKARSSS